MAFKDFFRMATTDSIIYHGVCRAALSMPAVLNIIIGFLNVGGELVNGLILIRE